MKDIALEYIQEKIEHKEQIEKILKIPQYVKKDEKIFKVFKDLQRNNQVIGIVCDEQYIPVGLISIEDILEKLVGKIFDEDDQI